MYPGDGKAQRADSGLLLIDGLALCDQRRTGLSVCPGVADVSMTIRGYCSLKGLPSRSAPDGSLRIPGVADVSVPIPGYCSLKGLPFAIRAGHRFPCARVTARRSAPIRGGYSHYYSDKCKDGNGSHRAAAGRNLRCRIRRPAAICTKQRAGDRNDLWRAAYYGVQRFSSPSCARA